MIEPCMKRRIRRPPRCFFGCRERCHEAAQRSRKARMIGRSRCEREIDFGCKYRSPTELRLGGRCISMVGGLPPKARGRGYRRAAVNSTPALAKHGAAARAEIGALAVHAGGDAVHVGDEFLAQPHRVVLAGGALLLRS